METRKFKFKTIYITLGLAALFLIYLWYQLLLPQLWEGEGKLFEVKPGDSFIEIGSGLKSAGVIKSKVPFWMLVIGHGTAGNLKAGRYFFEPGLDLNQVVTKIEQGNSVNQIDDITLVVPEGFKVRDIEKKMRELGFSHNTSLADIDIQSLQDQFPWLDSIMSLRLASEQAGLAVLEGFLFPDTYIFSRNDDIAQIVTKFLNNFDEKTLVLRNPNELKNREFYDVLIIASILEGEVPPPDMPLVSGILWKRLELGIPLQADATLVYALGRGVQRSDTTTLDSPYNTYKFKGLPPTPISNPGLEALKAALRPQKSPYLYYLSRRFDGGTVFSRTLEEHNIAKAKYLP